MRTSLFVQVFSAVLAVALLGLAGCSEDSEKISEPPPVDPCTIEENHCVSDEEKMTCQEGYVWRSVYDDSDVCCIPGSELIRCSFASSQGPGDPKLKYRRIERYSQCSDDQTYEYDCSVPHYSTVPASCVCKQNGIEEKSFTMDHEELRSQLYNHSWFLEANCNYPNLYHEQLGSIEKKKEDMKTAPMGCSDERRVKSTQDSLSDFAPYCSGKALFEADLMWPGDDGGWYSISSTEDPHYRRVMRGSIVLLGAENFEEGSEVSKWVAYVFQPDGTGLKVDSRGHSFAPMSDFITECKTIEKTASVLLSTTEFYETAALTGAVCTVGRGTQLTKPTVKRSDDGTGNYSTMITAPEIESICGWASGYAKKASVVSLILK